ncbi:MAG: adenylyl-sulfate kinase [Flavobacteriales bacterium]|nr:MAG: adenylyl-sulfate kinase [Flavobacteriales bacterium]
MNNLKSQSYKIKRSDYEKRNNHRGIVLWFVGLSGSGKSTIANGLQSKLFKNGFNAIVLDGDNTRLGINKDLGFSDKDRNENIRRVAEISKLFVETGHIVINAFISPFELNRIEARNIISETDFIEVYIDSSISACEKRDVKGLYKKARAGEIYDFTGISSPFEAPVKPDILVKTDEQTSDESIDYLFEQLKTKL